MSSIILQGAGGHAKVVIDAALAQGHTVECLFDPNGGDPLFEIPIRKKHNSGDFPEAKMVVAIGDNALRKRIAEESHHPFGNIVHPSAMLSTYSTIGVGNVILHRVIIQAASTLGNHIILNTASQVDHDCVVGNFVHLGPGTVLCGRVQVGEGTFLGAGTTVIPGVKIGSWSIVGAGSVVIDDIPDYVVAMGNPARIVRSLAADVALPKRLREGDAGRFEDDLG